jgi:hypothetical protein
MNSNVDLACFLCFHSHKKIITIYTKFILAERFHASVTVKPIDILLPVISKEKETEK